MNCTGIIIGLATFLTIGAFHPLVIWAEYHYGRRSAWAFAVAGVLLLAASLAVTNAYASILLGVVAFSSLWSILEVRQQHQRVKRGWFPMNPKRAKDYEDN